MAFLYSDLGDRWAYPREPAARPEEFVSRYDVMTKPSKEYPVFEGRLPGIYQSF